MVFGIFTGLSLVALYFVARQARRFTAWVGNTPRPRERVAPIAVMLLILGFVAGAVFQDVWDDSHDCRAAGKPPLVCLLAPR
jgi:hypothetical protein